MSKEKVFFIINHFCEIDWIVSIIFADRIDCLGYVRAFIKKVYEYIPIVGWFWKMAEFITLERSFEKDKILIPQKLGAILNTECPMNVS